MNLGYDQRTRPTLMGEAIRELQGAGVEPDAWKIEELSRRDDCERVVETAAQIARHLREWVDIFERERQSRAGATGHPEYGWTPGVETTTGPLGQGVATGVGMAIAQRWLAATYNRPGHVLFDFNVYALCGDGDIMEGISSEAASLAGHLKLANLCWIYDDNHINIEGSTSITFSEGVGARFEAYGWQVVRVADANDVERLTRSLEVFIDTHDRPTLVIVQSHIGAHFGQRGKNAHEAWNAQFGTYRARCPDLAAQIELMQRGELPGGWDSALPRFAADEKGLATRDSSGKVLNAIAAHVVAAAKQQLARHAPAASMAAW